MHIMMSADWFYPAQMGGPSNAIYWQAKAMTQTGQQVTVVATSQDLPATIPLDRWLTMDCGRVIYTKNPHFYCPVKHIWYAVGSIRKADIVHVNSLFYPSSLILIIAAKICKKRIIWSPHGELSPHALLYRTRLKLLLLRVYRVVSNGVIFHSTSSPETGYIRHHFGPDTPVQELPNMMETPRVAKRKVGNYLLFIGRLHPIKAIDRLLEALSRSTVFRASSYTLIVAGSGTDSYRGQLIEQTRYLGLSDKVNFIGAVYDQQKEQLYADAHVTILPSHSENFGNVVMESLGQGTPVIASTGTPWQLLTTEKAGDWVANTPEELRQAIEGFIRMPADTYKRYRQRAIHLARAKFDISANAAQWTRFYEGAGHE